MPAQTYHKISDLPEDIAVFPLPGMLLLPHWHLPLNVFEPRYLNMVDDAMEGTRLIGLVQMMGGARENPVLASVGCAGRITRYEETSDGRYLITLTGVARFRLVEELVTKTPYRIVRPSWSRFRHDLMPPVLTDLPPRSDLLTALHHFVERNDLSAEWSEVANVPMDALINALSTGCPFSPAEKQALLEAETLNARCETLIALLEMNIPGDDTGQLQ